MKAFKIEENISSIQDLVKLGNMVKNLIEEWKGLKEDRVYVTVSFVETNGDNYQSTYVRFIENRKMVAEAIASIQAQAEKEHECTKISVYIDDIEICNAMSDEEIVLELAAKYDPEEE